MSRTKNHMLFSYLIGTRENLALRSVYGETLEETIEKLSQISLL